MKVVKFGGSSLSCGANFNKVKNIVEADPSRQIVVVSAPGKRMSGDNKVTDLLYICHAHLHYKVNFDSIWEDIAGRYREIAETCGLSGRIETWMAEVRGQMSAKSTVDEIVSRGEYLNARLMAEYLGYDFVDSKDWLRFNYDGKVDYETSYSALRKLAEEHPKMVIPGFYGAYGNGEIHTFSRGGSDVTGALAAAALGAESYENWTDVSGILMADPRIVENPRPISRITYAELRELSFMGAEVLHEETVFPVRDAAIPLYIKNTNDPAAPGTLIMENFKEDSEEEKKHFITGITGKRHYTLVTIRKNHMTEEFGVIRKVLELTEKHHLPVEHIPSSIDSFSLVIASECLSGCLHELKEEIKAAIQPDSIQVYDGISLVAVVGRRMAATTGVSGNLFATLGKAGINIRLIEQGSDEINIIVGVMDSDFKSTIQTLYNSFT